MGAERVDEIVQRRSILHSARTSHSEQASNRDFTPGAAASEADLAPLYGTTQRSLRDVIGWFNAVFAEEGEEPFEILQQRQSEIGDVFVAAVHIGRAIAFMHVAS